MKEAEPYQWCWDFQFSCSRILGGIAIIALMLITVFHPSRVVILVTASAAMFLFAVFGGGDCTGKDVLAATAVYAAVLVVFVGTSMTA